MRSKGNILVARFILSGGTTPDCDALRDAHQLATDNTDRCVAVCEEASCPKKPLGPGLIRGAEKCTVIN